jgi:hypothetical protein
MANFFDQFDAGPADAQQPKMNFFDQFDAPAEPQSVQPVAKQGGNFFDQYDTASVGAPAQAPKPAKDAGFISGVGSGFMSGLLSQNPELGSEALEAWSHLGPEAVKAPLQAASRGLRGLKSDDHQTSELRLRDVSNRPELFTWLGEAIGQGVASSIPSIATGAAGAGLGAAIAGPPGAVTGGMAGALASSLPFNQAEVYKELKKHGIEPRVAAEHSLYAAVPMAALDVYSVGRLAQQFGMGEIKKQAARVLARRIAEETAKGATREGATEAAQEVVKQITVSLSADVPFWSQDNVWDVVESGAAGFVTGGAMSAPAGVRRDPVAPVMPTDTQINQVATDISGAKRGGGSATMVDGQTVPVPQEESAPASVRAPEEATSESSAPSFTSEPTPPAPVFYSQVEKVVRDKLPETFTTEQLLGTLQNSPGVKPEELEWLKVPEFAKRDGKVTKRELLEHLEDNAITIEDVTYSDNTPRQFTWTPDGQDGFSLNEEDASIFQDVEGQWQGTIGGENLGYAYADRPQVEAAIGRRLQDIYANSRTTTYDSWQALKGGENYREHLLRLPTQGTRDYDAFQNKGADLTAEANNIYQGPHWEPANIVAHYRTSQFTDVTGKRGLAVQEIQSDWHQTARKQGGYKAPDDAAKFEAHKEKHEATLPEFWNMLDRNNKLGRGDLLEAARAIRQSGPDVFEWQTPEDQAQAWAYYDSYQELSRLTGRLNNAVPNAPFKSNWAELAVKRILRQAADEGHERVYFTPGKLHAELYRQSGEAESGQVEFYDKILPRIVEKWAKKLGGKTGRTEVITGYWVVGQELGTEFDPYGRDEGKPFETVDAARAEAARWSGPGQTAGVVPARESVFYVDLTPDMASTIQRGLPMFAAMTDLKGIIDGANKDGFSPGWATGLSKDGVDFMPAIAASAKIVRSIANQLGMQGQIFVRVGGQLEGPNYFGMYNPWNYADGDFAAHVITVYPHNMVSDAEVYATVAHEFGHAIQREKFDRADAMTQLLVLEEYHKYREEIGRSQVDTMAGIFSRRDNFLMQDTREAVTMAVDPRTLSPERREYWLGFEEWFAENVARWMTTDAKALTKVDRLFKSVANALRKMYDAFKARTGWTADVNEQIRGFLEALEHQQLNLTTSVEATKKKTEKQNAAAMRAIGVEDWESSEYTVTTASPREAIQGLSAASMATPNGVTQGRASAAAADHFSKWYKWGLSVIQLAERNPHIHRLVQYKEMWQKKTLERQQIMDEAHVTTKAWKALGRERADNLAGLIDDYMNMRYLTPQEVAQGVVRLPDPQELIALVRNNKVDTDGLALFQKIQTDFTNMLGRYRDVQNANAMKIADPTKRAEKLRGVADQYNALLKQPYFPAMRFGDLTLEVRDGAGQLVEFFTFESKRAQGKTYDQLGAKYPASAGYKVKRGKLAASSGPLIGLPPGFLDLVEDKLSLSPGQRQDLELLRFELAPGHSFKHRFERKNRTPGYSMDFQRAYANYFFHGSNHLTRVKYIDEMRQVVADLRDESRAMLDGEKRMRIADFVDDHLNYMMNPTSDWSTLRAITFLWALGFSPAAALLNTTQVMVGSYPMLASGFGDVKAIAALTKSGAQLSTYYKKGTLAQQTDFELRAISEGVKEGVITEAMAPELAALSEGNNLYGSVGGFATRSWIKTMEWGGKMFELTEQWNRRVTFRAALKLAMENPGADYVKKAISRNPDQYDRLKTAGWSPREAAAFTTAKHAVEATQYIYGQYAQPKLMRGKLRTVFIFKSFIQNTLFMLWNNPSAAVRSLLVMAAIGGLMGLPGAEDLKGIIKLIGKRIFGSQWDLDAEVREFAVNHLEGKLPPDLILHGLSRYGMGAPVVMNWLGMPAPVVDMSGAVSMGNILPVQLDKMFAGGPNQERAMLDTVQRASGASFGIGFNIWKAINDSQQEVLSLARTQKAMPRAVQGVARSWQAFNEGAILNRQGNPVVKFDPYDTVHMMEMIAMAGGWQPLRLRAQWDRIIMEREAIEYWDDRRNGLLRQFWQASKSQSPSDRERVQEAIKRFNAMLPDSAKGKVITRDTISRSVSTRARLQSLQEQGVPAQKSNLGIVKEIQRLHPEAQVDLRPVR